MRNYILSGMMLLLISCGGDPKDKKTQLNELKKQQAELSAKIKNLEAEISKEGKSIDDHHYKLIRVTEIKPVVFHHYLDVQGKIDAEENITVSAEMPGKISEVYVKAGNTVKPGQVLAELDNSTIIAGISEAKVGLDFALTLYNKQKTLWDQKIGTEVQYLQAKSQKEQMEKRLATLNEQLDMTRIKSPISGTVDEVYFRVGMVTGPGAPGVRVVNMGELKAKAEISETYAGRVKQGNQVLVYLPDMDKTIPSQISFSGKVINTLNRTFTVEADINSDPELHPNMLAILKIQDYKNESTTVVPVNTIQNSEEGQYVMIAVKNNGHYLAKKVLIKTGKNYNGTAEILEGLNPGDQLITTGFQDLNNGDFLQIN